MSRNHTITNHALKIQWKIAVRARNDDISGKQLTKSLLQLCYIGHCLVTDSYRTSASNNASLWQNRTPTFGTNNLSQVGEANLYICLFHLIPKLL
jgi:hypothetical protein